MDDQRREFRSASLLALMLSNADSIWTSYIARLSESSKKKKEKIEPLRRNDDQVEPISFSSFPPYFLLS